MKVQRIVIKSFKVLKDLDINLEGKSVYLIGENGVGKSSLLQFIQIALGDSKSVPDGMNGEGQIFTTIDGQPYTFAVTTKKGKVELCVTLPDGIKETKRGVIGGIVGTINFDINEFLKKSESKAGRKEQVEDYKRMLPKEFIEGINAFEKKAKAIYDDRTEIGRKIETLKGFIKESKLFGDDLKAQKVDVSVLQAELEKINTQNAKIKEVNQRFTERAAKIDANKAKIEELRKEILELERVTIIEESTQGEAKKWIEKHQPIDVTPTIEAMRNADETNTKATQAEEHNKKLAQLKMFEEDYNELTVQYETNKQAISDAIKDFQSPVEGLQFDDEQLLYNGVAVTNQNLCDSEIIELGIKMKNASNPELGLMFVENSNLIGQKRLDAIKEYAKKHNLQMFYEEVKRGEDSLQYEIIPE